MKLLSRSARLPSFLSFLSFLAVLTVLVPSTAVRASPPGTEPTSETTVATYAGASGREEISREVFEDFLAHVGAESEADRQKLLESLSFLLRLSAEARESQGDAAPVEWLVAEERILATGERRRALAETEITGAAIDERLEELAKDKGLRRPRKVLLSQLFKRVPPRAAPETRAEMREEIESLREQILDGADFASLARAESDSQTAANGGRIGVVRPGDLPKPVEDAVFELEPGRLTDVMENQRGFMFFRCDRVVESEAVPKQEARDLVKKALEREAKEETMKRLRAEALGRAKATFDLAAARGDDPTATVVKFVVGSGDRHLDAQQTGRLARLAPGEPGLDRLADDGLRRLLEEYVVEATLAERARERSLDVETERKLRWQRTEAMARTALLHRVQARFEAPTERELRAYIEKHPERFVRKEHFRLQVARIDETPQTRLEIGRRVAELSRALQTGERSLGEVAREASQHPSADSGGHVGWWSKKRVALQGPAVLRAVAVLEPGEIAPPVHQDQSWWILKLLEVEPRRPMKFEEARVRADRMLGNERLRALQSEVTRQVFDQLDLVVDLPQTPSAAPATEAALNSEGGRE